MMSLLALAGFNWHAAAEVAFWASTGVLVYVYMGYPLLIGTASLLGKHRPSSLGFEPRLSILICAHNEEVHIGEKIKQTLNLDYPATKLEVIVVSDGSTDRTDEIVQAISDPRVRLVRASRHLGKTNAQNEGVQFCSGEIIVFSDATTVYHPMSLRYLAANYRDPEVGAVSGRYQYFDEHGDSPTGTGTVAFWSYENAIKQFQSKVNTITGCCGCIYSVRRSAYTVLDPDIISDLVQPLQAIRKGYRVVFESRSLAYEATTLTTKQEFAMRVRVVTRAMRGILSVRDLLNPLKYGWISFQLLSHKLLRWLLVFPLFLLLASNVVLRDQPSYEVVLALQTSFYACAGMSLLLPLHRLWRPLGVPLYYCTLNVAALVSMIEVLRGKTYTVWETVRA